MLLILLLSVAENPKFSSDHDFCLQLLEEMVIHHSCEQSLPDIAYETGGKPYFPEHPLQFNWSHSKGLVAVAVTTMAVGVDIQRVRPCSTALIQRVCSQKETEWLSSLNIDTLPLGFAFLWSGKEAYLKTQGFGVGSGRHLKEICVLPQLQKIVDFQDLSLPRYRRKHPEDFQHADFFSTLKEYRICYWVKDGFSLALCASDATLSPSPVFIPHKVYLNSED